MSIERVTQMVQSGSKNIECVVWFLGTATRNDFICANRELVSNFSVYLKSLDDSEKFSMYFPDEVILAYHSQNGHPLPGNRRPDYWRKHHLSNTDSEIIARQKRYLRFAIIKCGYKIAQILGKPQNLEKIFQYHPDTEYLAALLDLCNTLLQLDANDNRLGLPTHSREKLSRIYTAIENAQA